MTDKNQQDLYGNDYQRYLEITEQLRKERAGCPWTKEENDPGEESWFFNPERLIYEERESELLCEWLKGVLNRSVFLAIHFEAADENRALLIDIRPCANSVAFFNHFESQLLFGYQQLAGFADEYGREGVEKVAEEMTANFREKAALLQDEDNLTNGCVLTASDDADLLYTLADQIGPSFLHSYSSLKATKNARLARSLAERLDISLK